MFMNNFTRSNGNAYWHAITNLTCCSIDLKKTQLFKTFLVLMLFAFSSTSMFAQNRTTFYEVCVADRPEGLTEEQAISLFPNAECEGTLSVVKTENLQGGDCGWVSVYSYTLKCDEEVIAVEKLFYEGGDLEAPKLEVPADVTVECDAIPEVGAPTATDNCDDDVEITYEGEIRIGDDDCLYQLQRTWTATDNCGLTHTLSQIITVQDTKGPELNKGAKVPTGETGLNVCYDQRPDGPSAEYIASLFSDNCGDVLVEKDAVFKGTDCLWKGYINYYITDSCGNPADTITLYYNGGDDEAPVFVDPPADITVDCIDEIPANYALSWTDNCAVSDPKSKNIGVDDTSELGIACEGGVMTRTWEAEDDCGNKVTHTQTITVNPAPKAEFEDIADEEIKCEELASYTPPGLPYSNGVSEGACAINGVAQGVAEPFSDNCGSFVVNYSFTDECGYEITASMTVTVIDDVAPNLTIPADETVECDNVPAVGEASATDNCDEDVDVKFDGEVRTDGECADSYTLTRTWSAEDNCGNVTTLSQIITVVDETAPDLTIPADETAECDNIPAIGEASATDNCDADVLVEFIDEKTEPGDCENSYTIIRIWRATDNCGNSTTLSQQIAVVDTTAPELTIPADETVECDSIPQVGDASATDNCDDDVDVKFDGEVRIDGDCENNYSLERTWTATDNCGNETTLTQVITVVDTTAPEFTVFPDDLTIECSEIEDLGLFSILGYLDANEIPFPQAEDNCSGVELTWTPDVIIEGQECPIVAVCTKTFTITDACGNSIERVFTVTIIDTEAPEISVPENVTVECDEVPEVGTATAEDGCDDDVKVEFLKEERIDGECEDSYKLVRIWLAEDSCGNSVTGSQTITVVDTTAPVFAGVGEDMKIECPEGPVFSEPTASDNCDAEVTITFEDKDDRDECGLGKITRTWTATDNCGNSSQASQTIAVEDNVAPTIDGVADDYTVECPESLVWSEPSVKDECDEDAQLRYEDSSNLDDCGLGTVTRTWYATDCAGNMSQDSQTITIQDTVAPEISGVDADYTVECPEELVWSNPTASDACDAQPGLDYSDSSDLDECGLGTVTRTWTAKDCAGNTSSASQTITIQDTTPPVISGVGSGQLIECPEDIVFSEPTVSDTCDSAPSLTYEDKDDRDECGLGEIQRTWTATDCAGNTSTATQTIKVQDTTAPVINGVGDDFTVECPDSFEFSEPTASDDCDDSNAGVNGFVGDYAAENWTIDLGGADGSIDITETTMTIVGNNDEQGGVITKATHTCSTSGEFSFDWDYSTTDVDGPALDVAFYVNGNLIQLSDNNGPDVQSGSLTVNCLAGDVIGFAIDGTDGALGAATLVISNFTTGSANSGVSLTYEDVEDLDDCGLGTITRTWTATDCAGNSSQESQIVTIEDNTAPVIEGVEDDYSVECPEGPVFSEPTVKDECDQNPSLTFEDDDKTDECGLGDITRTWTATDCAGNTSTASQTITIYDNTDPYWNEELPQDVTEECDAVTPAATLTASDLCDTDVKVDMTEERIDGDCAGNYTLVRTWTAADCAGNSIEHVQTVTVIDTTAPVQIGEIPASVNEINGCADDYMDAPLTEEEFALLFEDNCSGVVVSLFSSPVGNDCGWSIIHIYTVADGCGNLLGDFKVYYSGEDLTAPELVGVPADATIECTDDIPAPANVTAVDTCDDDVKVHLVEDTYYYDCAGNYDIVRTWTATDDCGNTASHTQTIQVRDNEAPYLIGVLPEGDNQINACAPDTDQELADLGVLTADEFELLYQDSCSGVNVNRVINLDGDDCKWIMWVRYDITDDCGNEAQSVKVWYHGADMSAPTLTEECSNEAMELPSSQTGVCPADAAITYDAEITSEGGVFTVAGVEFNHSNLKPCFMDNCATQDELTFVVTGTDEGSVDDTCARTMTITFDVYDNCENAYEGFVCTFIIIDDEAPAITKAEDVVAECDGTNDAFETWLANNGNHTADDCNKVTWTNDYIGSYPATFTCDQGGSVGIISFNPPTGFDQDGYATFDNGTIAPPYNTNNTYPMYFNSSSNRWEVYENGTLIWYSNVASKVPSCDPADWTDAGPFCIMLDATCGDANASYGQSNECSKSTTVTFTATDECGNSSSTTSTFTVEDTTAPEFVDCKDETIELDFDPNQGPGYKAGFTMLGEYNGNYYYLSDAAMPATEALPNALANGGYAVTINNEAENTWVYNAVVAAAGGNIRYYIGYTDTAQEGVFVWQDGDTSTYTNWHAGEPNNAGSEDCAEVGFFGSSTWNDINCVNQSNRYVLEVKGASLKEEAAYTDACAGGGVVTDYSDVLTEIQGGNSTMLFSTVHWLITMNLSGVDQNGYDYYDGTIDNSPSGYYTYTLTFNTNSGQWELNEYYDYGNTFNFTVFTSDSQEKSPPCDISEYVAGPISGLGTEQVSCQGSSVVGYNLARTFVATDGCNSTECTINYTWTVEQGPAPTNPAPSGENGVGAGIQSQAQANDTTVDSMVELDFTAFPVPFDSVVSVKFNFEFDTDVTIEVHDTKGLLIMSETLKGVRKDSDTTRKLDLSKGADQLFYITVTTNQGSVTKKVVSSMIKRR